MRCRLCASEDLVSVVDLGATPPCEKFLTAEELDAPEPTFPLHLRLCRECLLLQIPALITPEDTFTEYAYFSSYSDSWVEHAAEFVEQAVDRVGLGDDSFVVEVASNDGYLLKNFVEAGVPVLGIDPAPAQAAAANADGVPTLAEFFGLDMAKRLRSEGRRADVIIANNVMAHVPDLLGFTRSLRRLVSDDGWVSIEVHHALNLVTLGQFDTIYHEHFQYYTALSAIRALATADLSVVDIEVLGTHGGSIRVWARPSAAAGEPSPRVAEVLADEEAAGLHHVAGYAGMQARAEAVRQDLLRYLLACKAEGKRVVGYGAPGKGNTLLNFCGIRPDLLEYTVDRNPYKHGRFTPGTRIPIVEPERIDADRPDVVLVLPWNLETELTRQLAHVREWGGELVYPLPDLHTADVDAALFEGSRA